MSSLAHADRFAYAPAKVTKDFTALSESTVPTFLVFRRAFSSARNPRWPEYEPSYAVRDVHGRYVHIPAEDLVDLARASPGTLVTKVAPPELGDGQIIYSITPQGLMQFDTQTKPHAEEPKATHMPASGYVFLLPSASSPHMSIEKHRPVSRADLQRIGDEAAAEDEEKKDDESEKEDEESEKEDEESDEEKEEGEEGSEDDDSDSGSKEEDSAGSGEESEESEASEASGESDASDESDASEDSAEESGSASEDEDDGSENGSDKSDASGSESEDASGTDSDGSEDDDGEDDGDDSDGSESESDDNKSSDGDDGDDKKEENAEAGLSAIYHATEPIRHPGSFSFN